MPQRNREQFMAKVHSEAELIGVATHHKRVTVLEREGLLPANWRDDIALDLSGCNHHEQTMVEVENALGVWGLMICVDCGTTVAKECAHVRCDWLLDGKVLRCGNCGVDAT